MRPPPRDGSVLDAACPAAGTALLGNTPVMDLCIASSPLKPDPCSIDDMCKASMSFKLLRFEVGFGHCFECCELELVDAPFDGLECRELLELREVCRTTTTSGTLSGKDPHG
eukprot:CAMPEP_0180795188 /NCGR_PEP_ID=MMETSP1038_2-20121128/56063_1 /TAXON_ID=632150 /ORGANISM="Azadinium spinosum, Strain 3D9" /LENGTH=111 /DNA_ID=CAMNT_0022834085 /DNA_START=302 /DNA_END=638 /DNA_ORIENTATION=-